MSYSWNDLDDLLLYRGILREPLVQLLRSDAAAAEKTAALIKAAEELLISALSQLRLPYRFRRFIRRQRRL